jgi:hypothetical protein
MIIFRSCLHKQMEREACVVCESAHWAKNWLIGWMGGVLKSKRRFHVPEIRPDANELTKLDDNHFSQVYLIWFKKWNGIWKAWIPARLGTFWKILIVAKGTSAIALLGPETLEIRENNQFPSADMTGQRYPKDLPEI